MIKISDSTIRAIKSVWAYIAYDVGEVEDNEVAVELCLDANRLEMNGFEDAAAEIDKLFKGKSYNVLLKDVSKQVNLV